jgi:hypothetical protein
MHILVNSRLMMGVPVAEWPVYQRRLAKTVDKQKCRGIPVRFVYN